MQVEKSILQLFPTQSRPFWMKTAEHQGKIQEIRLRVFQPISIQICGRETFLNQDGNFTENVMEAARVTSGELENLVNHICRYSLYAYEEELRQGYITVEGGHRVGIAGQAVQQECGTVRTVKNISFINIRIAHEIKGAADEVIKKMYKNGRLQNTLIISPPGCGKTTLLRDLIRQVSDGNSYGKGMSVGVIDERSELAGCVQGVPQLDVGMRTDVMDACPKKYGMMMLLRSMSPGVIAIDELGNEEEFECLKSAASCGCRILATVHGENLYSVERRFGMEKKFWGSLFDWCLVLKKEPLTGRIIVAEEDMENV